METVEKTLSEKIRDCRAGVISNPYQGTDKKVVFVCSMGILRSATAARMYGHKYNTRSAGTWTDHALIPLTDTLIAWADELVFVNDHNYQQTLRRFEERGEDLKVVATAIKVLDIPDAYEHMHPELIKAFEEQYERR